MVKNQQMQTMQKPSSLETFNLDFEYNKSIRQVRQDVRARTHKG